MISKLFCCKYGWKIPSRETEYNKDWLEARLAIVCAASAVEYCDPLWSPCMMPYFPDISSPQPTSAWTGAVWRGGHSRLLQVNSSSSTKRGKLFECVGEPLRDIKGVERQRFTDVWPGNLLGSVFTFPNRQSLQTVPASACKHCFETNRLNSC